MLTYSLLRPSAFSAYTQTHIFPNWITLFALAKTMPYGALPPPFTELSQHLSSLSNFIEAVNSLRTEVIANPVDVVTHPNSVCLILFLLLFMSDFFTNMTECNRSSLWLK